MPVTAIDMVEPEGGLFLIDNPCGICLVKRNVCPGKCVCFCVCMLVMYDMNGRQHALLVPSQ